MNVVTLIPYWHDYLLPSGSIEHRDLLKIGRYSLLERMIKLSNSSKKIDRTYLFTSYSDIKNDIDEELNYIFLERDKSLDSFSTSIEDIIESFLQNIDADMIVLLHPRCPFIKHETISDCIQKVKKGDFDSAFVATTHRKFAWFNSEPLNLEKDIQGNTRHLAEVEPVILESSAAYVFKKTCFMENRSRISEKPFIKLVGRFEGFEVDSNDDFKIAELIVNAGLDKTGN